MLRKMVLKLLGLSWVLVAAGIGLAAMMAYSAWSAEHGGGIPAEDKLTSAQGHAVAAREVTEETRRRRGGKRTQVYYEIDLKSAAAGEPLKLRIDHAVPAERIRQALDEELVVKYDPEEKNLAYAISLASGEPVFTYQQLAELAQKRADDRKAFFSGGGMTAAAVWWTGLGLLGMWLRRRMLARDAAAARPLSEAGVDGAASGGSIIGADLPPRA